MADISERVRASFAGRYTIERELGRGGMATVYLARDLKHDRPVALKVLRPELAAVLGAERFLREIRLTAQLQHPHILTLIDSGEAEGFLYYVMPCVEGESLRQRLEREGQLPLDEALRMARAIASALDFAHGRGVIHRDIKPENIMLHQGEPMVADFGIALAVSTAGQERLTETGLSLGTPAYMSPEQASAEPRLDGRSDQYSLACVLYEMLAGEPPYTGPTAQAIIAKRLSEPIPHLSTVRRVPPAVEAALTKALAKAPADRFANVGELCDALCSPSRSRWRSAAVIALSIAAALAGAWGLTQSRVLTRRGPALDPGRRSVAVLPFVSLSPDAGDTYFAEGITEDISSQLARIRDLKVVAHTSARTVRDRPPREIGSALGVGTLLEGSVRRSRDQVRVAARLVDAASGAQLWAEEYDRALKDVFVIQREIAERIATSLDARLTPAEQARLQRRPTTDPEAYDLYLLGRHYFEEYAGWSPRRSIEYFKRAIARDSAFALAWVGLADAQAFLSLRGGVPANEAFPKARSAALAAIAVDSTLGEAHASLGLVEAAFDWDWRRAEASFGRALALSPNSPYVHMWYATFVLTPLGRHDEALAEMRRAVALDPLSMPVRYNLGFRYYFARRYEEAIAEFRRGLEMDPAFVAHRSGLAFSLLALGRFEDAIREMKSPGSDSVVTGSAVLGYAYALAGRNVEARAILRGLEERARRTYVIPLDFSLLYTGLGMNDEAFRWLRKAYEERATLLIWINAAAWYDRLRPDPRFGQLVRDIGLGGR